MSDDVIAIIIVHVLLLNKSTAGMSATGSHRSAVALWTGD